MADIQSNLEIYEETYDWGQGGEEWSKAWGGSDMQWYFSILPRLHQHVPCKTILEIAPGFGRWTEFLLKICKDLVVVDFSNKCIQACKDRFKEHKNITYHVNDGKSLDMVEDDSIDLVFSYDSLVHVEEDVIEAYLSQIRRKLTKEGVGFIHHSNIGEYGNYFSTIKNMPKILLKVLKRTGFVDTFDHYRSYSMTAKKFHECAEKAGLKIISQEIVGWGTRRLIDSISVFTRKDSSFGAKGIVKKNKFFMKEVRYVHNLSNLYGID